MAQQRTWRQRRQDAYQLQQLTDAWLDLKAEKENCMWHRHHETAWAATARNRYDAARIKFDATVESWLSYCRRTSLNGNVVEIHHP